MSIEAVLLDKDGTLFDFQATWSAPYLDLLDELAPGDLRGPASEVMGFDEAAGRSSRARPRRSSRFWAGSAGRRGRFRRCRWSRACRPCGGPIGWGW